MNKCPPRNVSCIRPAADFFYIKSSKLSAMITMPETSP